MKKPSDIKNPASEVDGVTGATLTSDGVSMMLQECMSKYKVFFYEK
ncbi:FMN-binding protein [Xylanibacter rodentium]|nr:FMN-binding protein [Xylanibacter rodentium]